MAQVKSYRDFDVTKGLLELTVLLKSGKTKVVVIPKELVATLDQATALMNRLDSQDAAASAPAVSVKVPTDFSFLSKINN